MKKSKIIMLLLAVVMILTVSAVSAAEDIDTSDSVLETVDEAPLEEVALDEVDEIASTSDSDVLADTGDKNFTVLQDEINSASGVLNIESNYVRNEGESDIEISNGITLIGDNTHKIDANKLGAIFKIKSGITVTLNNVILVNGNNDNGGAIYNEGTLNVIGSQIINSNASIGGAIYNKGIASISGSTLEGNTAAELGGAIYNEGTLIVGKSTFNQNKVTTASAYNPGVNCNGGAGIFSAEGSSLTVKESTFTANEAVHPEFAYFTAGGAIYVYRAASTLIDNCKFNDNIAGLGGAVVFEGFSQEGVAVSNSEFTNNQAWQGGAVNVNEFVGNLVMTGNNFTENKAVGPNLGGPSATEAIAASAGAVSIGTMKTTGTSVEISDSIFTKNTAEGSSGAISINSNTEAVIENCDFVQNEAGVGSAICSSGNSKINGSRFNGNKGNLGTVYLAQSENSITNCEFEDNDDKWGEILNYNGTLTLSGNYIDNVCAGIISWGSDASVDTKFNILILDNETYITYDDVYEVTAYVTDDSGNIVRDLSGNFKFLIDGTETIAVYDAADDLYKANCAIPDAGIYLIDIVYDADNEFEVQTSVIKNYRGTFTDLNNKVTGAEGTLDLAYDFTYTPELDDATLKDGVVISNALTINGNGYTISGNNAARIFKVSAKVTINNTKLIDGSTSGSGAAIYATADLTIDNCVFERNDVGKDTSNEHGGSAIMACEGVTLTINNSNFTNNGLSYLKDDWRYGAVAVFYKAVFDNCIFTNNAAEWGGAITAVGYRDPNTSGAVYVKNSKFYGNYGFQGGAIFAQSSYLEVDNCVFENNKVTGSEANAWAHAGAVFADTGMKLTNSNFTGNYAQYNGGAVYYQDEASSTNYQCLFDNCRFEDNYAGAYYGALRFYSTSGDDLIINNTKFINNVANGNVGGALQFMADNLIVENTEFKDNSAKTNGGAMDVYGNSISVINSNFTNNKANGEANAIYLKGNLALSGNTINSDVAEITVVSGEVTSQINITVMDNGDYSYNFKAIKLYATITDDNGNLIKDTTFKFLVGTTPVVAVYNDETKLYEATYTPSEVGKFVVSMTYDTTTNLNIKTANITFAKSLIDIKNMIDAAEEGATVELDGDYAYIKEFDSENGISVDKKITIDGKGYTITGSNATRIFNINADDVTIKNITIINANSTGRGGAIYVDGAVKNTVISDAHFYNNTALSGGAIAWDGDNGKLINSEFKDNKANDAGGAVFWFGFDGNITGTTFTDNTAVNNGGAVAWISQGWAGKNGVIEGSTFTNNKATANGGAVFWDASNGTIIDSTFTENQAPNAGAVYWAGSEGTITGDKFSKNKATANLGGAIFVAAGDVSISSEFEENTAINGGAIALFADGEIKDSIFTSNEATSQGGAIFTLNANADVSKSTFTSNNAPNGGKAIYVNNGELALSENTIDSDVPAIDVENGAKVTSTINITVLDAEVKTINDFETALTAKVTDDNGNLIKDAQFKFTINNEEVPAVYNAASKLYEATYTLPVAGIYAVNVTYVNDDKLVVENATVKCTKGTFTDLQNKLAGSEATLEYNFAYVEEIDGAALKDGVVIDHAITIDGKGFTISGNDQARIFQLNAADINIKNITFINGYLENSQTPSRWGAAIYSNGAYANHIISDSKFYNNTAYNGAAIYLEGDDSKVINSEFKDNKANASGGAIFVIGWNDNITGSTFTQNTAGENGGAVVWRSSKPGVIETSTFIKNTAVLNGGAVFWEKSTGSLTDSTFKENEAGNGGAVYWKGSEGTISGGEFTANKATDNVGGAIFSEGKDLTISSKFTDNTALNGGAITLYADATIKDSEFTSNIATSAGGAIFINNSDVIVSESAFDANSAVAGKSIYLNTGKLSLNKNTISGSEAEIAVNEGSVDSTVNATILENQTLKAELGETVKLTLKLTDDNGNLIYDSSVKFTVNGVDEIESVFNAETGLYEADYEIAAAGLNIVSTTYDATIIENGAYTVEKANATLEVIPNSPVVGENATVAIKLFGANDVGLTTTVKVIINNKEYSVEVKDGEGELNVPDLGAGQYPVVAILAESANYNAAYASDVLYVKQTTKLTCDPSEDSVDYGTPVALTISLTDADGNAVTGIVDVTVAENDVRTVLVEDGVGTLTLENLNVGEYNLHLSYAGTTDGSKYYEGSNAEVKLTINAIASSVVITPVDEPVVAPGELTVTYTESNGVAVVVVKDASGNVVDYGADGKVELSDLAPGVYTVNATIEGNDNVVASSDEITFTVVKQTSSVEIDSIGNDIAPANVTVTFTASHEAVITVTGPNGNVEVKLGDGEIILTGLTNGTYIVNVTIADSTNIEGSSDQKTFVVKAVSNVELEEIADIRAPGNVNITYTEENGHAVINVTDDNGNEVAFTPDGNKIILTDLPVGIYHVTAVIDETDSVAGSRDEITVTVVPGANAINITTPENSTDTVFSINLPEDAEGYLLVDINGQNYYAKVENGNASVTVPNLTPGNYSANITYTGDDKYDSITETTTVSVPSNVPENALTIPENSSTDSPTYSIDLPGATGYLEVDVDGTKYVAPLVNGSASITVPGLADGKHNVTVTYTGDETHSKVVKSTTLEVKVPVPVYKITQNKNINVVYSAKAAYKVLITKDGKAVGAGESVTINFNGKNTVVKTDSKGYASLNLNTKVKVKSYTIKATYNGVTVKNTVKVKHLIKAKNIKVKKSKKVNKIKVKTNKVNGKFLKGKKLKLKVKGKTLKAKINKKGVATFKLKKSVAKKLKAGKKYKYTVSYGKDKVTKKMKVKK